MMESEWRNHVEHDESHLRKWGCTAMGSLTKCGQHTTVLEASPHKNFGKT